MSEKMVYFNAILFCCVFSHFIFKTESDLLKGILLGSALKNDDSEDSEVLVIRIPGLRGHKKPKRTNKPQVTTTKATTTTSTTTSTPSPKTISTATEMNYGSLDTIKILTNLRAQSSTPSPSPMIKRTEYSTQISVTTENICGANQTYTHCLNECGHRCTDKTNNKLCPTECFGIGCTCAENFVRDLRTDYCVKPNECPKSAVKCPVGERFFVCGGCGPTCEQPIPVCSRICRTEGGCDCIKGLVRNVHGKCIPLSLCTHFNLNKVVKTKPKLYSQSNFTKNFQSPAANNLALKHLFDNISEDSYHFN